MNATTRGAIHRAGYHIQPRYCEGRFSGSRRRFRRRIPRIWKNWPKRAVATSIGWQPFPNENGLGVALSLAVLRNRQGLPILENRLRQHGVYPFGAVNDLRHM